MTDLLQIATEGGEGPAIFSLTATIGSLSPTTWTVARFSAIEISDAKHRLIYVGTEMGNIFKSDDAGNRWSQQDGDPGPTPLEWRRDLELPAAARCSITRIEVNPNDAETVFASP